MPPSVSSEHNSSSWERERGYMKYPNMINHTPLAGGIGLGLGVSTRYYPSYQPMTPPIRPQPSLLVPPILPLTSLPTARINSNRFDAFSGSNMTSPPRATEMGWFQKLALADSLTTSPTVSSDTHHLNGFHNNYHAAHVSNHTNGLNGFHRHQQHAMNTNHEAVTMTTMPTRRRRSSESSDVCAVDEADDELQPMSSSSAFL